MLENVKFPSTTPDVIRCMDLDDSLETIHAAGSSKGGSVSGSVFYDPADTVHQRLVALVHSTDYVTSGLKPADRKIPWNLKFNQYDTPKNWAFTGIATKFDISGNVAAALKADLNIEVESTTAFPS
jgi:hypothetical protein